MPRPTRIITKAKKGWSVAEVAEHLPKKCEALSSNSSTTKKKKKKKGKKKTNNPNF
jgi:hypothetical protein